MQARDRAEYDAKCAKVKSEVTLNELTAHFQAEGGSHAAAETKAKIDPKYKEALHEQFKSEYEFREKKSAVEVWFARKELWEAQEATKRKEMSSY